MTEIISVSPTKLDLVEDVMKIHQFFDQYSKSSIEEKLRKFYRPKVFFSPINGSVSYVEDFTFYENLLALVQNLKQVILPNFLQNLLVPTFTEHTLVDFEGVVNLIKKAIPVGAIYNLGKTKSELDLIIVLEKSCTKPYSEFESIIDLAMLGYPNGTCTVHNYGLLNTLISKGHLFYATACIKGNLVYRKNMGEIFAPVSIQSLLTTKTASIERFRTGMDKAINFYQGAQHYFNDGILEMAIFMLHQACELTYRCLLNVLREKDVKCHSPAILRKHVKRFAPEIIGVFSEIEEEELSYLQVLEDAYIKSRYHPNYTINYELIVFLNERVGLLQERARILFEAKVDVMNQVNRGNSSKN